MAFITRINDWSSDPCLTEIDEDNLLINCHCNMIDSIYYGVFNDVSRIEGEPIKSAKDIIVEPKSNSNVDITNK